MIFQFQTGDVTFFDEDKAYFKEKLGHLEKYLGYEAGDADSVDIRVSMEKNKHSSGNKFEMSCTMYSPHHGKFHAEIESDTIKKAADFLHDKLKAQVTKFHDKHK